MHFSVTCGISGVARYSAIYEHLLEHPHALIDNAVTILNI